MINNKGLTLIEIIIYIAIISAVLTVMTYFAWDIISGQTKSVVITEVNQNLRYALERIGRDMRQANSLVSLTSDNIVLAMSDGNNITYTFTDNNLIRQQNAEDGENINNDLVNMVGVWQDLSTAQSITIGLSITSSFKSDSLNNDWHDSLSTTISYNLRSVD